MSVIPASCLKNRSRDSLAIQPATIPAVSIDGKVPAPNASMNSPPCTALPDVAVQINAL